MIQPYFLKKIQKNKLSLIVDYINFVEVHLHMVEWKKYICNGDKDVCIACKLWHSKEYVYLYDIALWIKVDNKILLDYDKVLWCNFDEHRKLQQRKKYYYLKNIDKKEIDGKSILIKLKHNADAKRKEFSSYESLVRKIQFINNE